VNNPLKHPLGKLPKPAWLPTISQWFKRVFAATASTPEPSESDTSSIVQEQEQSQLVPYDENLLERSRTQWQFGDWETLAKLDRDTLQHHPDRAKLALLAAAGHQQQGNMEQTRQFTRLAQDWGCGKKLISQVLIAGVYNTLGKASAIAGQEQRALGHFEESVRTANSGGDVRLLTQARVQNQLSNSSSPNPPLRLNRTWALPCDSSRPRPWQNRLRYAKNENNDPLVHNVAHQHAAKHALCHYASGAIYSFIPKNGCTTFRYSLAIANKCISGPEDFEWIHKNNDTFRATLQELINAPYSFVFLRCPYMRLASVYLDKIVNQRDVMDALNEINIDNIDLGDLSFRHFVKLISNNGAIDRNHHWKPQISFLVYQNYSDWFNMESFSKALKTITQKIGLKIYDTRNIARHGTDQYKLKYGLYADTPARDILAMQAQKESPAHASLYDTELIKEVTSLYNQDIVLYEEHFGKGSLKKNSKIFLERN